MIQVENEAGGKCKRKMMQEGNASGKIMLQYEENDAGGK